jgi:hypothetical protein
MDCIEFSSIFHTFAVRNKNGLLAEWLGSGLQNRVRRFESARDLWVEGWFLPSFFHVSLIYMN